MKLTRRFALVASAIAASALLSAFQPASAQVFETGRAFVSIQQGDFELRLYGLEDGNRVCTYIRNVRTEEYRDFTCASGDVEVSDTLESASARGTTGWSKTTGGKGKGSKAGGTSSSGTVTIDAAWTGTGNVSTEASTITITDDCGWIGCYPGIYSDETSQTRSATLSGTIIDSEWGPFVLDGASGSLYQQILPGSGELIHKIVEAVY